MKKVMKSLLCLCLLGFPLLVSAQESLPMVIQEQGSFMIGGSILRDDEGNTFHGDHGYVFFQKPVEPRKYPLVFLHGIFQSSKTWETTPDGREGFQNIFLRRGYSTYNMTHPRRGHAGRSTVESTMSPVYDEHIWFTRFRLGKWPDYFEGVQFPRDSVSLEQYFRQVTPNIGPIDFDVNATAVANLFDKLGGAVMVAHSQGGGHTWLAVQKTDNIKGIVAWEPGLFYSFPEDEPRPVVTGFKNYEREYIMVSPEAFEKYTKIPTLIIYGDNTPAEESGIPMLDEWGVRVKIAKLWAEVVNRHGGDVTVIHLPEIGIYGNTHFPFSDLNNIEMADLMEKWLKEKNLN